MAQRAIREADGKRILARWLGEYSCGRCELADRYVTIGPQSNMLALAEEHPWLATEHLVAKPDQLLKRRGKSGLLLVDANWHAVQSWLLERMGKPVTVGAVTGVVDHFIVEPFLPHRPEEEHYLAIVSRRDGDLVLFHPQGGVDVGDIDAKARRLLVPIGTEPTVDGIQAELLDGLPEAEAGRVAEFGEVLFRLYRDLHFAYLELNPVVVNPTGIVPLDMAAKLDDTAEWLVGDRWGPIEFPPPFGRELTDEEKYVSELDAMTGASLKLMVLQPKGRIWSMIAGGGASVIFADTITDMGFMDEMANYGEYSGDPNAELTYLYAKTILDLMTRYEHRKGKILLIGGGIANFTDVAATFTGIVRALREYQERLRQHRVKIYVRRGGPNYQEGLRIMKALGEEIGVPMAVYGPETHMTRIVSMALKEGHE
jgi:ATP citrate (pro-S)-lyase